MSTAPEFFITNAVAVLQRAKPQGKGGEAMSKEVRVEAVWKDEIDIHSCVLALLALAQDLPPEAPTEPPASKPPEQGVNDD